MEQNLDVVGQTWTEVGYKVRPLRNTVFVRTLPLEEKVGSLYLPAKLTKFYGELPHQKTIRAVVLAVGPKAKVKPGEKVCFTRLYFAWWKKLEDGCMVGWIDENQLTGYIEED